MQTINGFQLEKDFSTENAGFCRWAFAKKGICDYFVKEFLSPNYPEDGCGLSEAMIEKKRAECAAFFQEKSALYDAVKKCRTGNIAINHAFFRNGPKYYAVTERMYPCSMTPEQISALSEEKKEILIRSLLYSFAALHRQGVVHADVKPDNILIKKTKKGFFTGKIIDFDSGFFESSPPRTAGRPGVSCPGVAAVHDGAGDGTFHQGGYFRPGAAVSPVLVRQTAEYPHGI